MYFLTEAYLALVSVRARRMLSCAARFCSSSPFSLSCLARCSVKSDYNTNNSLLETSLHITAAETACFAASLSPVNMSPIMVWQYSLWEKQWMHANAMSWDYSVLGIHGNVYLQTCTALDRYRYAVDWLLFWIRHLKLCTLSVYDRQLCDTCGVVVSRRFTCAIAWTH